MCDLAIRLPEMVSEFLEFEALVKRRFREESVSDIIVASLLKVGDVDAMIIIPYEYITGSDFDILIVDPNSLEAIQYRIQAKRLLPHNSDWSKGSYREITHPHGTGKQASKLVRSSAHEKIRTIPLYAFYNPEAACRNSGGLISGIELASGIEINRVVKKIVKAKPRRPPYKRVGHLQHLFFPLTTILCAESSAQAPPRKILSPRQSLDAVVKQIASRASNAPQSVPLQIESTRRLPTDDGQRWEKEIVDAPLAAELSPLIRKAIEQRREQRRIRADVRRPKILLISEPIPTKFDLT